MRIMSKGFGLCLVLLLMFSIVPSYGATGTAAKTGVEQDTAIVVNDVEATPELIAAWLEFTVYTDQEEYRVGDEAMITAILSSNYLNVDDATVWATVEYPDGDSDKIRLKEGVCAAAACECPESVCKVGPCPDIECVCDSTVSCWYEAEIDVEQEGAHYITAYAEVGDRSFEDKTKFWAYSSSDTKYVRLDQKFNLELSQSAIVSNYGKMRVTLSEILNLDCAEPAIDANSVQDCVGAPAYAVVTVRGPLLWEASMEDAVVNAKQEIAYTETQVTIREGSSASVFGTEISLLDLDDDEGTFIISRENHGNYVDVKVDPTRRSVELGDEAEYKIVVKDLHTDSTVARAYDYKITVLDLPFGL